MAYEFDFSALLLLLWKVCLGRFGLVDLVWFDLFYLVLISAPYLRLPAHLRSFSYLRSSSYLRLSSYLRSSSCLRSSSYFLCMLWGWVTGLIVNLDSCRKRENETFL